MVDALLTNNLTKVTDALRQYVTADKQEAVALQKQLLQLTRIEGVVNLARPFVKTYTHYVSTEPQLPTCMLQVLQCYPNQEILQRSCQLVVIQYLNTMASLEQFVAREAAWTPEIQDAFVDLYETVNTRQFGTLLKVMQLCKDSATVTCTSEVSEALERLLEGNEMVMEQSKKLLDLLNVSAPTTLLNTFFNKCFEWNSNLMFYLGTHVLGPLAAMGSGIDWRNPSRAKWYTVFYTAAKKQIEGFSNPQWVSMFEALLKPPEIETFIKFDFFDPLKHVQTEKGKLLYYFDYLHQWNNSLMKYIETHYVHPLMVYGLTEVLMKARDQYLSEEWKTRLTSKLIELVGDEFIPELASGLTFFSMNVILPVLLPYVSYYGYYTVDKLFKFLEKQIYKTTDHMKYVLSALPPSPTATVQPGDLQTLKFLDQVVESNKGSWSYRVYKWFISLLRRDAQTVRRYRRIVAYQCVRPQRQCIPVLQGEALSANNLYFLTHQRCKARC